MDADGLALLSESGELQIPFDSECEDDDDEAIFLAAYAQSHRVVRQQFQDRRNARGGYVDKPKRRGKQTTTLTIRTSFKDKVGGKDLRGTVNQLLTRIRCYMCGKLGTCNDAVHRTR